MQGSALCAEDLHQEMKQGLDFPPEAGMEQNGEVIDI